MTFPDDYIKAIGVKPYHVEDDGIIYCADCLDILPKLPAKSVDLVITDPPYSVGTTSTGHKGDWLDNNIIRPFFEICFSGVKTALKDSGEFYVNTDWRTYPFLYPIIVQKMRITNCIIWDYEWIKAGSHYRFSHEFIIYGQKLECQKRKFSASERDVWRIPPLNFTRKEKAHQAEKPLELINKMIVNSSNKDEIICDLFIGSGSTLVAAKQLRRKYIGIEISEKYCEIAVQRLQQGILI